MRFAREEYTDEFAKEAFTLNKSHDAEISCFPDIPLEPDYEQYKMFQNSGMFRVFTARENGALVGYSLYFVRRAPHYKSSIQAVQDLLFLRPEMRKGLNGYKFILWCDGQLRNEGVQVTYQSVTMQGKDFGPVLERMGYKAIETLYARRLDLWEDK